MSDQLVANVGGIERLRARIADVASRAEAHDLGALHESRAGHRDAAGAHMREWHRLDLERRDLERRLANVQAWVDDELADPIEGEALS